METQSWDLRLYWWLFHNYSYVSDITKYLFLTTFYLNNRMQNILNMYFMVVITRTYSNSCDILQWMMQRPLLPGNSENHHTSLFHQPAALGTKSKSMATNYSCTAGFPYIIYTPCNASSDEKWTEIAAGQTGHINWQIKWVGTLNIHITYNFLISTKL